MLTSGALYWVKYAAQHKAILCGVDRLGGYWKKPSPGEEISTASCVARTSKNTLYENGPFLSLRLF